MSHTSSSPLETSPRHGRAVLAIVLVWAGFLGLLAVLGWMGQGTGLTVWPMGEDQNWMELLDRPTLSETARGLWKLDNRNPLSPWWYIAGKGVIFGYSHGLFLLRHIVGLGLALSGYWVISLWLGPKARNLAIVTGCLVAVSASNAYFDQIYWNFLGALVCSLLCLACYLKHQRAPGDGQWLAAALVLWLVAISTYTIQAGTIVAIAYSAWLLRRPGQGQGDGRMLPLWSPLRLVAIIRATWPFAAILVVFILIWQTTSVPLDPIFSKPEIGRFLSSLRMGLWHDDHMLMLRILGNSPNRFFYVGVSGVVFVLAAFVLGRLAPPRLGLSPLHVIALVGCIAAPTLFVETIGSMWPPGTRWRMIYQFTTPAVFVALLAVASGSLGPRAGRELWRFGVAACFAGAVLASLTHNALQMSITRDERALRRVILSDSMSTGPAWRSKQYLVFLDQKTFWLSADTMSPKYAKTWFGAEGPSFRLVPSVQYAVVQTGPAVTFMADGLGVANATVPGATLPYSQIRVVMAKQGTFTVVDRLEEKDLVGFRAVWQRDTPLQLAP